MTTKKKKVISKKRRKDSFGSPEAGSNTSAIPPPDLSPWSMWKIKHCREKCMITRLQYVKHLHFEHYLQHAITLKDLVSFRSLYSVKLPKEVEGDNCIDIDDHTRHQHCHGQLQRYVS